MAKRFWDLTENPKNHRWYLNVEAGASPADCPSVQDIRARAAEKGIPERILSGEAELKKRLGYLLASPGEEASFPVVIDPSFDVRLNISPDKTSASLYVRKASDPKIPLDFKLISTVLNTSHIKGLDAARIQKALNDFRASPDMELPELFLAQGAPPKRGKDRELVPRIEWLPESETQALAPLLAAWSREPPVSAAEIDLPVAECTRFARVSEGQTLFSITEAEYGEAGVDVFGKTIPGLPGNDPFFQAIENILHAGADLKAEKTGVLAAAEHNGGLRLRLIPYLDAKATVSVDERKMIARLLLEPGLGAGKQLTASLAEGALHRAGIKGKIETDQLDEAVARIAETGKSEEIVVLQGCEPVPPGGIRVTWDVGLSAVRESVNVTTGERICTVTKFPLGAEGQDVYGKRLPAATGTGQTEPAHDATITETNEGGTRIFTAVMSGELTFRNNTLEIAGDKKIDSDVDDGSGDISFPGNLELTGEIRAGRTVRTAGNLTVNGNAEAALVIGEGTVNFNGGILGMGRGTVWAKKAIHLVFAENARLLATQDITVDNHCFQCMVKTNGKFVMRGNPAALLGGTVRASKGIDVYELGSSKTIRTAVSFGQNYLIGDKIEVCEKEIQKSKNTLALIDAQMQKTANTDPRIHELRRKKLELLKHSEKLSVRIFTLKEQYETHVLSSVRVENTVWPGVILESHGRYFEVREKLTHVEFIFDQITGQITCSPIPANEE